MAQPPTPQAWPPAAPRSGPTLQQLLPILIAVVAILAFGALFASVFVGSSFPFVFAPFFVCMPIVFFVVFLIILVAQGAGRRRIPPPPPIQQPMVPAGQQGPVALNCPNCGGPPTNVDRFGIATCSYCGTRFLVR